MILTQEISEYIENLRGRRTYEQKKSRKPGFESLKKYIEHKLQKRAELSETDKQKPNILSQNKSKKNKKNSSDSGCSCCSH